MLDPFTKFEIGKSTLLKAELLSSAKRNKSNTSLEGAVPVTPIFFPRTSLWYEIWVILISGIFSNKIALITLLERRNLFFSAFSTKSSFLFISSITASSSDTSAGSSFWVSNLAFAEELFVVERKYDGNNMTKAIKIQKSSVKINKVTSLRRNSIIIFFFSFFGIKFTILIIVKISQSQTECRRKGKSLFEIHLWYRFLGIYNIDPNIRHFHRAFHTYRNIVGQPYQVRIAPT